MSSEGKKRKKDSEYRSFNEEWKWKYCFTMYNGKPMCLLCNENVSVPKEYNISRHFNTNKNTGLFVSVRFD